MRSGLHQTKKILHITGYLRLGPVVSAADTLSANLTYPGGRLVRLAGFYWTVLDFVGPVSTDVSTLAILSVKSFTINMVVREGLEPPTLGV